MVKTTVKLIFIKTNQQYKREQGLKVLEDNLNDGWKIAFCTMNVDIVPTYNELVYTLMKEVSYQ